MEKIRMDGKRFDNNPYLQQLKKEKCVQSLLNRLNLDESAVEKHLVEFANYCDEMKQCEQCKGLFMCSKNFKGMYYEPDENLQGCLRKCRYQLMQDKELAHRNNYLICDLSDTALHYDFGNIDLSKENEQYGKIVHLVEDVLDNPAKGLYFVGPLGVGKSYLAACMTNHLAKEGKKVAFANFPRLVSDLRMNIDNDDYKNRVMRSLKKADCLVLDDIGAENMSNYIRDDILFTVLDYRMEHKKLTIFTSNCKVAELKKRLASTSQGDDEIKALRIVERIKTLSIELPINGESRRTL